MHNRPDEDDWKEFRNLTPILRERYLRARNEELVAILGDEERSSTEKFWDLQEQVGKIARDLRACLDGHSRTRMRQFMMQMLGAGMMTLEDLDGFSEDLRNRMIEWSNEEP